MFKSKKQGGVLGYMARHKKIERKRELDRQRRRRKKRLKQRAKEKAGTSRP
jgi:hypothetical protein